MKLADNLRKYGIVLVLVVLFIVFSILSPAFLTFQNLMNIARQISMMSIVAVGFTFVLIGGGLDLSVGSQLAIMNIVSSMMIAAGVPVPLALLAGILLTTLVGMFNGFVITRFQIPPLIATLATMTSLRGLAFILCGGYPIYGMPDSVKFLGQGYIFGVIPVPVVIMLVIIVAGAVLLNKTFLGRYFYALGCNEEATRLAGINVGLVRITAYSLLGFLTGIAGMIMLGRVSSGQPGIATGLEMDVLTSIVLGGVSINGGKGTIFGAFIGAVIIGTLSNGMSIVGINEYYQQLIKGIVLLAVIIMDSQKLLNKRQKVTA